MHLLTVSGSVVKLTKGGEDEGRGGWVVWCGVFKVSCCVDGWEGGCFSIQLSSGTQPC